MLKGFVYPRSIGLIVDPLPLFFFAHFALGLDPLVIDLGVQQPLRLEPQSQLQLIGGENLEVKGAVVRGVGIEDSTRIGYIAVKRAPVDVLGSFKHEVLEEVGESGPVGIDRKSTRLNSSHVA